MVTLQNPFVRLVFLDNRPLSAERVENPNDYWRKPGYAELDRLISLCILEWTSLDFDPRWVRAVDLCWMSCPEPLILLCGRTVYSI